MPDTRTPEQRRRIMQSVKGKDTKPEQTVRHLLHRLGYRYRLHSKSLPGHPDLVFSKRKKVIFVHGCFWHGHGCRIGKLPKSRLDYWEPKIRSNQERDERTRRQIEAMGWKVMEVWQCQLSDSRFLETQLREFLGEPRLP